MGSQPPNVTFEPMLNALREAGARLEVQADAVALTAAYFDSLPLLAWIKTVDPVSGVSKVMRVNRAFETAIGLTSEEFLVGGDELLRRCFTVEAIEKGATADRQAIIAAAPVRIDVIVTNQITGAPMRLIGHKWRVPSQGPACAVMAYAMEYPVD